MRAIWLIARNFIREQRWPILILLFWVALLAALSAFSSLRRSPEDLFVMYAQVAAYILIFSLFFGASAIRNEVKTKRILAVLSKGISRGQYLAGLLLGIVLAVLLYCFALGIAGAWTLPHVGVSPARLWLLLIGLLSASLLTAAFALFFSIFLHPLLATSATIFVLGAPMLLSFWNRSWELLIPVYAVLEAFVNLSARTGAFTGWLIGWSLMETAIVLALSAWLFARKDISVQVE
jgi:ABC-type transport system involved in multi-copper enzyme maturation permease subunit